MERGCYPTMQRSLIFMCFVSVMLSMMACGNQSPDEKSFEAVWQTVNETHHDPDFGGIDWKAHRTGNYLFDVEHSPGQIWMSLRSDRQNLPVISTSFDRGENWFSAVISDTERGNPSSIAVVPTSPSIV